MQPTSTIPTYLKLTTITTSSWVRQGAYAATKSVNNKTEPRDQSHCSYTDRSTKFSFLGELIRYAIDVTQVERFTKQEWNIRRGTYTHSNFYSFTFSNLLLHTSFSCFYTPI